MLENQHSFETENAKLVKELKNCTNLDAMVTYFKKTTKNLMKPDHQIDFTTKMFPDLLK